MNYPAETAGRDLLLLLEREDLAASLSKRGVEILDRTFREVLDRLRRERYSLTPERLRELVRVGGVILKTMEQGYDEISSLMDSELRAWAKYSAQVGQMHVGALSATAANVAPISPYLIEAAATIPLMGQPIAGAGRTWLRAAASNVTRNTVMQLQQGILAGEGIDTMVSRIMQTGKYVNITRPETRRHAVRSLKMFVRTAVNATQTEAQFQTYKTLGEFVQHYVWVSTLDSRTSLICIELANTLWRYDDPDARRPPAHLNCRSVIFPVPRIYVPAGATHYTANGIPDMAAWLKAQPEATQNEMLGRSRAEWYRAGKLSLRELLDGEGRPLTVAQLRDRMALS